jgi:tRNA nucleotidyltransferase/poly(A) polymerase
VAPERIRAELFKLLEATRVSSALRWAVSAGVLAPTLGVAPGNRVDRLARRLSILDSPVLRRCAVERRRLLRLSLIAAGLGLAPSEAVAWFSTRRFSREEAGSIARLLELAQSARRVRSSDDAWRWVRDSGEAGSDALRLLCLLHPMERGRASSLGRRAARPRRGPRVTGRDVLAWLPISEGPGVGELLRELEVEILRGHVRNRREARKWLCGSTFTRELLEGRSPAIIP